MRLQHYSKWLDLLNISISRSVNFILTVILFYVVSRKTDARDFSDFGYWWSIALLVGGIVLGGVASAVVRVLSLHGTLHHLKNIATSGAYFITLLIILGIMTYSFLIDARHHLLLVIYLLFFGFSVQAQALIFSLLRAMGMIKLNIISSLVVIVAVPLFAVIVLAEDDGIYAIFAKLSIGFLFATILISIISYHGLKVLGENSKKIDNGIGSFIYDAGIFTLINIFSYALINIDFSIFRWLGSGSQLELFSIVKIYFERFVLPLLLMFAGVASLRVLRRFDSDCEAKYKITVNGDFGLISYGVLGVALIVFGYYFYTWFLGKNDGYVDLIWIFFAALGYILYAINGVIFDILVVQARLRAVIAYVISFLLLGTVVQLVAIYYFSIPGWAVGWMLFNLFVFAFIARDTIKIS